jgi:hypothetical protein
MVSSVIFFLTILFFFTSCASHEVHLNEYREIDPTFFKEIDKHALSTPASSEKSVPMLAEYLTSISNKEIEKVRSIYIWITDRISYDTNFSKSNLHINQSVESILKTRIANAEEYSKLFLSLCKQAGIDSQLVHGYSKGLSYFPGKILKEADHSWNAVRIDGEWRLLDTTWGAGNMYDNKFKKEFSDFYFLTHPKKFISDHFPLETKWQLLQEPQSKIDFYKKPKKYSAFYSNYFENLSPDLGILSADEYFEVSFENPKKVQLVVSLGNEKQFTYVRQNKNKYTIEVRSPGIGTYDLKVYGKDSTSSGPLPIILEQKIQFQKKNAKGIYPEILDHTKIQIKYPKLGTLKNGQTPFSFQVYEAQEIAFVDELNDWQIFTPKDGSLFTGSVLLEEGEIKVFAKYDSSLKSSSNSWHEIMKFQVAK